jgi:prepilin-type N-terminal cleavage/methylation domain-containing protein
MNQESRKGEQIMKKMDNKGFSLVELIVVIAIMAVLMGVLAPTLLGNVEKSKLSKDKSSTDTLYTAFTNAAGDYEYSAELVGYQFTYSIDSDGKITVDNPSVSEINGSAVTSTQDQKDAIAKVKEYVGADSITYTSKNFKSSGQIIVRVSKTGKVAVWAASDSSATPTYDKSKDFFVNCADYSAWGKVE